MKIIYTILLVLLISISGLAQTVQIDGNFTNPKEEGKLKYGLSNYSLAYQNKTSGIEDSTFNQLYQTQKSFIFIENDSLLVDLIAESDILSMNQEIKKSGLKILASAGFMTTCKIHFNQLQIINKIVSCRWAQPVWQPSLNSGNVQTQGDLAQRSDIARAITGLNGSGVKIGVISDSFNNLGGAAASVNSYELPGSVSNPSNNFTPVTVLLDFPSTGNGYPRKDEGRAMLEIIHDIAPKAQLYFSTGSLGIPVMVNSIRQLANAGCKVIVDDIGYSNSPYFQDGALAQIVDSVVNNMGVIYFSSAGNMARLSYEANFTDSNQDLVIGGVNYGRKHQFANGVTQIPLTIYPGSKSSISFQWAESFKSVSGGNGAINNFDFFFLGQNSNTYFGTNINQIGGDPYDYFSFTNNSSDTLFYLTITRKNGSNNSFIKFIEFNNFDIFKNVPSNIIGTNKGTIFGHSNSEGAISVGESLYWENPRFSPNTIPIPLLYKEESSSGGVPVLFNTTGTYMPNIVRNKPDFVGPTGGNTSFFGQSGLSDGDNYPNFFGTSASAPHLAAVAALMKQAKPNATVTEIKTKLISSCTDMDDPNQSGFQTGFDYATGYGFVNADVAVKSMYSIAASTPSITSFCQGSQIQINFTSIGVFPVGNQFRLELSDVNGTFSNFTVLGLRNSISNNTNVSATIPFNTPIGSNYKVRIRAFYNNNLIVTSNEIPISILLSPPSPILSSNISTLCGNQSATITVANCNGTVNWLRGLTGTCSNCSITNPSGNGIQTYVAACVTNGCTSPKSDTLTINWLNVPSVPLISIDKNTICIGDSAKLSTTSCSNGTVSWFNEIGTQIGTGSNLYVKVASNNYRAKCTVNGCTSGFSLSFVTYLNVNNPPSPPTITISNSNICQGQPVALNSTTCPSGNISWHWGSNSRPGTTQYSPNTDTSGVFTYTSKCTVNACGSQNSNPLTLTINPTIIASISSSNSNNLCSGDSTILSVTPIGVGYNYQWKRNGANIGINSNTYIAKLSGIYSVMVSKGPCSSTSSTIEIVISSRPSPPLISINKTNLCNGDSALLTATNCTGTTSWFNNTSVYFATGSSVFIKPLANSTNNYSATCTSNSCSSLHSLSQSLNVNTIPNAPTISSSATSVCVGGIATISATGCTGTVNWSTGATGASINVNTSASTTLNFTATCTLNGCISGVSNSVSVTVSSTPTPPVLTSSATSVCVGGSATLTASGCVGTVLWSTGENGNTINVNTATPGTLNFTAICSIGNNCVSGNSNTISVIIGSSFSASIQAPSSPNPPTSYCQGSTAPLFAVPNGPGYTFQWKKDGVILSQPTDRVFPVSSPGVYSVIITQGNCSSLSNAVTITEKPTPSAPNISSDKTEICFGQSVNFTASGCTGIVTWNFSNTPSNTFVFTPSPIPGQTGLSGYVINARCNLNSCFSNHSNDIAVNVSPIPTVEVNPTGPIVIHVNGSDTLNASVTFADTYQWYRNNSQLNNQTNTSLIISQEGNYKLLATNSLNQCFTESNEVIVTLPNVCSDEFSSLLVTNSNMICPNEKIALFPLGIPYTLKYEWYQNNELIPNANSFLYRAINPGVYYYKVKADWYQVEPKPTNDNLKSIYFNGNFNGWIVGDNSTLLKTSDGGENWEKVFLNNNYSLTDIIFLDSKKGWITTYDNRLLKTINGGISFEEINLSIQAKSIDFINASNGIIVGSNGKVYYTNNGGDSWNLGITNLTATLNDIKFKDNLIAFAIGQNGAFLKTIDGGANWQILSSGTTQNLNRINFFENNKGWVIGDEDFMLKTTDNGQTWNSTNTNITINGGLKLDLQDISFINQSIGYIVDKGNSLMKTIDGGISWSLSNRFFTSFGLPDVSQINKIEFKNNKGFLVGAFGAIVNTIDGGTTWATKSRSSSNDLNDAQFIDNNIVVAIGDDGELLRSLDNGKTWTAPSNSGLTNNDWINGIYFISQFEGWAADSDGDIFKSTNGGSTWSKQRTKNQSEYLFDIFFKNSITGFAIGSNGLLLKTSDGGLNWTQINLNINNNLRKIHFINDQIGWISGTNGLMLKTIDGGLTWTSKTTNNTKEIKSFNFINQNKGWAIANDQTGKEVLKTVDGGNNWSKASTLLYNPNDILFENDTVGLIVGQSGWIAKTTNGGLTWQNLRNPINNGDLNRIIKNESGVFLSVGKFNQIQRHNTNACNFQSNTQTITSYNVSSNIFQTQGSFISNMYSLKTMQKIESVQNLESNSVTDYNAGKSVTLLPGFKLNYGAVFNAEIKNCSVNESLVIHYPFNGNANDISGNNLNGTVTGAALVSDRFGQPNKAMSFDGNDRIVVPNFNQITGNSPRAISVWVKTTQNNIHNYWISWGSNLANRASTIGNYYDGILGINYLGYLTYSNDTFITNSTHFDNNWHNVVVSSDGFKTKLFIDGILKNSRYTTYNTGSDYSLFIGCSILQNAYFTGILDDIKIYKRHLFDEEVLEQYNLEKPNN
ncbi:MAG: YCF48-related protein [Spirosomataceae bacterium]